MRRPVSEPTTDVRPESVGLSPGARMRARALAHPGFLVGSGILVAFVLAAVFAPWLAPHDPYAIDLVNRRTPPVWHGWLFDDPRAGWRHPFGTDGSGRDYLSRLIYGTRISLAIGLSAVLIGGAFGTFIGVLGGYFGGRVDMAVNFLIATRLSLPVVLVALAVVALLGGSLTVIVVVLGLLVWDRFAVVIRSATMQARNMDYVTVARACGCSPAYIIGREILPNILNPLIVVATIEMAIAILIEAALSFLGLGVQPPAPSWGLMLAEAKVDMFFDPWMIMLPGAALFILIFAINVIGDGLRDVTAPEGRN